MSKSYTDRFKAFLDAKRDTLDSSCTVDRWERYTALNCSIYYLVVSDTSRDGCRIEIGMSNDLPTAELIVDSKNKVVDFHGTRLGRAFVVYIADTIGVEPHDPEIDSAKRHELYRQLEADEIRLCKALRLAVD